MAGCAALAFGQEDRAIEFLSRALKIKPDSPAALEYRAQAQAQRERWAEAIKDVSEAIRLRPDTGRLKLQRCWYHLFAGDMTAAVTDAVEGLGSERLEVRERFYLGIVASLGRRGQNEPGAAKTVLDGMTVTVGSVWPGAIVRFLKGESTLEELDASAVSPGEKDQARVFAGWLDLVEGRRDAGRARLQSVIENGPGSGFEHHLARALLTTERGGANPEVRP